MRIYGGIIPRYYAHIDTVIGELVATAPANAKVVVLSDHGMAAINHRRSYVEERIRQLRALGYLEDSEE